MTAPADWSDLAAQAEEACANWQLHERSSAAPQFANRLLLVACTALPAAIAEIARLKAEVADLKREGTIECSECKAKVHTAVKVDDIRQLCEFCYWRESVVEFARLRAIIAQLGELAKREHTCLRMEPNCDCGATEHNQRVDALVKEAK